MCIKLVNYWDKKTAKFSSGCGKEIEFAMLRMNLHRSRITGSMLQAAPGSWCIAVTLTHNATQNGHGCEMKDKKPVSAALCAAPRWVWSILLPVCLSVLLLPFLFLSSPLLLVSFSLPLSIPFCLVFFVYILLPYITISIIFIFIRSPSFKYFLQSSSSFCFFFFLFLSFRLYSLPLPLVYLSSFSNFFILYTFHHFFNPLIHAILVCSK